MPELPEVETVTRALRRHVEGRVIVSASINRADLRWPIPPNLAGALAGRRVLGLRRRGKYILARLDDRMSLLIHLGMSGRLLISREQGHLLVERAALHEHASLSMEDGWRVALIDPRRFGALDLMPTDAEDRHHLLARLGPEPLEPEFDGAVLARTLAGRRTTLKAALLDQRLVAGLGNIYVSEALFRARLSPLRLAGDVGASPTRARRLVASIKETLTDAIAAGGSSLRDYVQPDGELGYFQHAWKVYGRTGEPCERCPGPPCAGIERLVQAGRSTFFCRRLQR